jgi:acyl carrier protein
MPEMKPAADGQNDAWGKTMTASDSLLRLLTDFFNLPPGTAPEKITQPAIASWDSLAMVQLIADLQGTFSVEFDLDEIETLRSYDEIHRALSRKGVSMGVPTVSRA